MKAVARGNRVLIEAYMKDAHERSSKLAQAVADFQAGIIELMTPLRDAVEEFNETADSLNEVLDAELERLEEFLEGKGARWRAEHEDAYNEWKANLTEARIERVDEPDEITIDIDPSVPESSPPLHIDEVQW
jgi:uncharacterized protein YukE